MNLTIEDLKNHSDTHWKNIEYAKGFYGNCPVRPTKPLSMAKNHTSEDAKYAKDLEDLEAEFDRFNIDYTAYKLRQTQVDSVIEAYIKEVTNFKIIPDQYQAKVWEKAYQDGHSGGYSEVMNCLFDLVEIFG